jgi:Fe-S cluster assembly iron-binding protein IscA
MSIEITDDAVEVLRRSLALGNVGEGGGVRLRGARGLGGGFDIQVELADGPLEGEHLVEKDGVKVFVDPEVTTNIPNAVVALEPQHETIVVRPAD